MKRKVAFIGNQELSGRRTYLNGQRESFDVEEAEELVAAGRAEYVSAPPEGSVAAEEPAEEPSKSKKKS